MNEITIAGRKVGLGHPPMIAAEVGLNHNGDLGLALRTIDAAAEAGCDAVKFQAYRCTDFLDTQWDTIQGDTWTYTSQGRQITESKREMFCRYQVDREFLLATKQRAEKRGLIWHATPTSPAGVWELAEMGASALKNGGDMINNLELLRSMAGSGLPVVMSCPAPSLLERALTAYECGGGIKPIVLHTVRRYPCPIELADMSEIMRLQQESAGTYLAGYSDHTEGIAAAIIAVQLGACWVEKHFTLDRNLPGPDHAFSADPQEMRELVRACKAVPR